MTVWNHALGRHDCVRLILACLVLAMGVCRSWGQGEPIKTGQQEGTLVINYYSTAPDPELEQLRGLALEALGVYLRGQLRIDDQDIGWSSSVRATQRTMERTVADLLRIRSFSGTDKFGGFSSEVSALLLDFEELDLRDVERMRGNGNQSFEARTYVLIEQRIQEILLQCGVDLGHFVNRGLLQKIGTLEQRLPKEELEEWLVPGENATLEPLEINVNLEDMSLLGGSDESAWPDEAIGNASGTAGTRSPELEAMQSMMERILTLVESQDARISALEAGKGSASRTRDLAVSTWQNERAQPSSDPALQALNLPSSFDIQFYEGSFRLTLTSQLQLNEVMEFMAMYPQLRVVCTGHADVTGDRSANLALSKRRAQAVRTHLLESGVLDTRVVLNYFGEERATNRGALDRRVEVSFFVND